MQQVFDNERVGALHFSGRVEENSLNIDENNTLTANDLHKKLDAEIEFAFLSNCCSQTGARIFLEAGARHVIYTDRNEVSQEALHTF
jgi:hypothetical protein